MEGKFIKGEVFCGGPNEVAKESNLMAQRQGVFSKPKKLIIENDTDENLIANALNRLPSLIQQLQAKA